MNLLQYTFFQHALLGSLLASIACGIIGTYIVTRRLVFISGGITHASFGGIGLGLYAGISPILSAAVFSVLSAFGVEWLSKRKDMREDSAIAMFWTLGMALGIMFSFLSPGFAPDLSAYLFGKFTIESHVYDRVDKQGKEQDQQDGKNAIGYLSCLGGLLISYRLNVPSGASIIFFSILIYIACKIGKSLFRKKQ